MAAQTEVTSTAEGEGQFLEQLTVELEKRGLTYIMDRVKKEDEECTLTDLMKWQRKDISQLIDEINQDKKIKIMHKNRFIALIVDYGDTMRANSAKQDKSQQIKLLFVGNEEQEAIDCIEDSKIWIQSENDKITKYIQQLDKNISTNKNTLKLFCESMKCEIDKKQQRMIQIIDEIHRIHTNKLNQRNDTTQKSIKMITQYNNQYKLLYHDKKLSKMERIQKLHTMKTEIQNAQKQIKQFQDSAVNMSISLNENILDSLRLKSIVLANIGVSLKAINITIAENETILDDEKIDIKQHIVNTQYVAKWSSQHKKDGIQLTENDVKAISNSGNRSVRSQNAIQKGMMVKLKFTFFCDTVNTDITGNCIAVSSERHGDFKNLTIPYYTGQQMDSYGIDIGTAYNVYEHKNGKNVHREDTWGLKKLTTGKEEIFYMLADFRNYETCCLSFYDSNMKLLAPPNAQYSMKLPERTSWYPVFGFWNSKCWCKMQTC